MADLCSSVNLGISEKVTYLKFAVSLGSPRYAPP